jgi:DNA-binding transcriptional MerR regulator
MSLAEMKEYLDLCLGGEPTIPQRKLLLAEKQQELRKKLASVQEAIDYIDWKQQFYDDVLSGKTKYYSNLLPEEEDTVS